MSRWLTNTDREAMQIIRMAMAKAVCVFWDLLLEYSSLDSVRKLTGEPR